MWTLRREARILLLVDPDEAVLNAVCAILGGRNHRVQTARTTGEAVGLLEKQEFDVVRAGLEMPESQRGNGLVEWLVARKPILAQHLVLMRAVAPSSGGDAAAALKGCRILQQPFKATELLAAVEELLTQVYAPALKR